MLFNHDLSENQTQHDAAIQKSTKLSLYNHADSGLNIGIVDV